MIRNALVFLLLLSVGLNFGLGWRLLQNGPPPAPDGPPPPSWEEGQGPEPRRMMEQRLERMARVLELTRSQRDSLAELQEHAADEFFSLRDDVARARRELRDLTIAGAIGHEEVLMRQRAVSTLQARLDSLVVESMLAEVQILTPAQREQYRTLLPWGEPGHRGDGRGRRH